MQIKFIEMRWGTGDNYAYLVTDDVTKDTILIDPAEPDCVKPVVKSLEETGEIKLTALLNTHHHWDHSGGNETMKKLYPELPLIAGKDSPGVTTTPADRVTFKLGEKITVTPLHTPCHTQDSICYLFQDGDDKAVFTGDTLFTAGAGRFFEGTATEMNKALNEVLASLPDDTKVYPGHEYTASNIKFAKAVLSNEALDKLEAFTNANEHTTGKFTIGDEKSFNPFMRLADPQIQKATGKTAPDDVMHQLREMKNKF
ncbi:beta-lactamase-like protein [Dipodascopsis tothii]|uniref:beta-lactamase-like protein n=1 Tax=Dipodascopsis tothii TaxID=44089 RepID=UPI0034CE85DF